VPAICFFGKHMKYKVAIFLIVGLLCACTTAPSTVLITPQGKSVRCASVGAGGVGVSLATEIHKNCVEDAKSLGALPLSEVGYIGVNFSQDPSTPLKIIKVSPNSGAEMAGMRSGDVVVAINGQTVTNLADAKVLIFGRYGTSVSITYRRDKKDQTVVVQRISSLQQTVTPQNQP
jgi:S1-C subfamily serine protease